MNFCKSLFITVIKRLALSIIWQANRAFYGRHVRKEYSHLTAIRIFKIGFIQKVIGINRCVPWPVHPTTEVLAPERIQRGSYSPGLSMGCFLDGRNGIIIEDNVWIGPRVSIISQDHENDNYAAYRTERSVLIKKNSLICANAVILPGVSLGEHTIVAAGAVVTQSFLDGNQILAGNPAQVVKRLGIYHRRDTSKCAE